MIDEQKAIEELTTEMRVRTIYFDNDDPKDRFFNYGFYEGLRHARALIRDMGDCSAPFTDTPKPQDEKLHQNDESTRQTCGSCVSEANKEGGHDAERE